METEITETVQTQEQEKTQVIAIATSAIASITNVPEYKKTLTDLVDKHKGAKFINLEDKEGIKAVSAAYSETRQARLAVDKLGKNFKGLMKQIIEHGEGQIDELLEIVSPEEKRFKGEKDKIDTLKQEAEDERLRQLEEKKQARIAKLFDLGLKFNGAYYEIGDLNITPIQVTQYSEAQFEGFVAQATVAYEAEQLRIAEEAEKEAKRIAAEKKAQSDLDEANRKAQELLTQQNEAKQRELDESKAKQKEQDDLIAELQAKLQAQEPVKTIASTKSTPDFTIDYTAAKNDSAIIHPPKGGYGIKVGDDRVLVALHDVLVTEEAMKGEWTTTVNHEVRLVFDSDKPFIDTAIGKSTLRIYVEQFLDEAQDGLDITDVPATGSIGDELLFMVIKGK